MQGSSEAIKNAVDKIEHKLNSKNQIIVNIQGDLPIIYPDMIDSLIMPLIKNKNIQSTTMIDEVQNNIEFNDPNRVKVVFDKNKDAYQKALDDAGYKHRLEFEEKTAEKNSKNRIRKTTGL